MKTKWPDDVDGDALRRLEGVGFDFQKPCTVDFNVDFDDWPPPADALALLGSNFPSATIHDPSDDSDGYVQFQVFETLSYALVTGIQAKVSAWVGPYGGVCESWGVLH